MVPLLKSTKDLVISLTEILYKVGERKRGYLPAAPTLLLLN